MDQRKNFLAFALLDALEDENESDITTILERSDGDVASCVLWERGIAPLHYACGMENAKLAVQIVKCFLEMGGKFTLLQNVGMFIVVSQPAADANVRTDESISPLHVAAMYGRPEIVALLLKHGAQYDVYDAEHKTPVHYAIEECHFEVVEVMRDHIFVGKYEHKQHTGNRLKVAATQVRTPQKDGQPVPNDNGDGTPVNRVLRAVAQSSKYTPNRIHYNYDVTSPYYINVTHRRHKPQPKFPATISTATHDEQCKREGHKDGTVGSKTEFTTPTSAVSAINIFKLTKENVAELSQSVPLAAHSRASLIDMWRDKVQTTRSRKRSSPSLLTQFDDINSVLEQAKTNEVLTPRGVTYDELVGSDNWDSLHTDSTAYASLPDNEPAESERIVEARQEKADATGDFVHSPTSENYFMQLAKAYVHTDDENGMVFYETKLLSNHNNRRAKLGSTVNNTRLKASDKAALLNATITTQSTNFTVPSDYETDALRAELTTFGVPPGPITKTTKRLYIKQLIKCQRDTAYVEELNKRLDKEDAPKFSVELHRTVRSLESFERIPEYMRYDTQSTTFFTNNDNKKKLREGHLKQSFIYMLIDPRISCNLPGESVFLDKFAVWRRFLQSIFYVGKGKTSRPYSHLYDAMKMHMRLCNTQAETVNDNGKKVSIKKQALNVDLFKSAPKKSSDSKKLDRILEIWGNRQGVVCLHVFHNIMPTDAYTREAAIIDALGLQHLTNVKRGDYYGPARTWSMREKKYLGIALLFKAMQIFLAEGESQLSPGDLI